MSLPKAQSHGQGRSSVANALFSTLQPIFNSQNQKEEMLMATGDSIFLSLNNISVEQVH